MPWDRSNCLYPLEFRYCSGTLWAESLKALAGAAVCGAVALSLPFSWFPAGLIGLLGIAFAWYGARVASRTRMRILLSAEGLQELPSGRLLPWCEVLGLQLVYYSTRRDREDGWMELTLRTQARTWRVDSRLDDFHEFVRFVLRRTNQNQFKLDSTTAHNLKALAP